jgi:hypothetical protein
MTTKYMYMLRRQGLRRAMLVKQSARCSPMNLCSHYHYFTSTIHPDSKSLSKTTSIMASAKALLNRLENQIDKRKARTQNPRVLRPLGEGSEGSHPLRPDLGNDAPRSHERRAASKVEREKDDTDRNLKRIRRSTSFHSWNRSIQMFSFHWLDVIGGRVCSSPIAPRNQAPTFLVWVISRACRLRLLVSVTSLHAHAPVARSD